jgi:hypothetical protein
VKGEYLNGQLKEDVYMRQPEGFIEKGKENFVCKLNKSIYGLKQSGRVWHGTMRGQMERIGFTAGNTDSTVYFRFGKNGEIEILRWYVDDGLMAANAPHLLDQITTDIEGSFDIQNLGEPSRLLGIKIERNHDLGTIHISQPVYIDVIAKRFNISPGKCIYSPMESNVELQAKKSQEYNFATDYAALIGSINYCAIATRPDITIATNKCAQFS